MVRYGLGGCDLPPCGEVTVELAPFLFWVYSYLLFVLRYLVLDVPLLTF